MEGNIKDAIKYLVNLGEEAAKPEVIEIAGKTYCTKSMTRYGKEEMQYMAERIKEWEAAGE